MEFVIDVAIPDTNVIYRAAVDARHQEEAEAKALNMRVDDNDPYIICGWREGQGLVSLCSYIDADSAYADLNNYQGRWALVRRTGDSQGVVVRLNNEII